MYDWFIKISRVQLYWFRARIYKYQTIRRIFNKQNKQYRLFMTQSELLIKRIIKRFLYILRMTNYINYLTTDSLMVVDFEYIFIYLRERIHFRSSWRSVLVWWLKKTLWILLWQSPGYKRFSVCWRVVVKILNRIIENIFFGHNDISSVFRSLITLYCVSRGRRIKKVTH